MRIVLLMKRTKRAILVAVGFSLVLALSLGCRNNSTSLSVKTRLDSTSSAEAFSSAERRSEWKSVGLPHRQKGDAGKILVRKGYVASYNKEWKIPNWVAWHLTREHVTGDVRRPGSAFHEDLDVARPRATLNDYKSTVWSRGHMCPAGDNKWSKDAMYESFLLTNVCPQDRGLNNGVWNQIELSCRKWAERYGDIYIVCGPIVYRGEHEYIGANKVLVPEAFFKVVLCPGKQAKGIGFVVKNTNVKGKKDMWVNSISQVERITGLTFFPSLNKTQSKKVKSGADLAGW